MITFNFKSITAKKYCNLLYYKPLSSVEFSCNRTPVFRHIAGDFKFAKPIDHNLKALLASTAEGMTEADTERLPDSDGKFMGNYSC